MAAKPYYNARGERIPGVTTVIGRFTESGGLVHSAWKIANEGLLDARTRIKALLEDKPHARQQAETFLALPMSTWEYRAQWGQKADAGSLAHKMVENYVFGRGDLDTSSYDPQVVDYAETSFLAFLEWARGTDLQPMESELRLVSEELQVGGTLDTILVNQAVALGDWKTGRGLYGDALIQIAAYGYMYEASTGVRLDGGYHLFRFDRETAGFRHSFFQRGELDFCLDAFKRMRDLYDLDKRVKDKLK